MAWLFVGALMVSSCGGKDQRVVEVYEACRMSTAAEFNDPSTSVDDLGRYVVVDEGAVRIRADLSAQDRYNRFAISVAECLVRELASPPTVAMVRLAEPGQLNDLEDGEMRFVWKVELEVLDLTIAPK